MDNPVRRLSGLAIALSCCVFFVGCGAGATASAARQRVRTVNAGATETTANPQWPSKPGMTVVGDSSGHPVGYVQTSLAVPRDRATEEASNARTLLPVVDQNGNLVGYVAFSLGFIPLSIVNQPGFDVEDYRASKDGGCEPQIGDGVGEKYPICPDNDPSGP